MRRPSRFEPKIPPLFDFKKGDKVTCRTKRPQDEHENILQAEVEKSTPKECVLYFKDGSRITLTELSDVKVNVSGKTIYFL